MVASRRFRVRVVAFIAAVVGATTPAPASAQALAPPDGGERTPYLASFRCGGSPDRTIGVSRVGDRYIGNVNWVPEHFVSPAGAHWDVSYDDGMVHLVAQGQYLPLPGQPPRRGTMELTVEVTEGAPTVTHSGTGPGSGDSNDQQVHLRIARELEAVGTAQVRFDNGSTYAVAGCTGQVLVRTMDKQSDPRADVRTGESTGGWCDPVIDGGRVDELSIDTFAEDWAFYLSTYDDGGTPDDLDDDTGAFLGPDSGVTLADVADGGATVALTGETLAGEPISATVELDWSEPTTGQFAVVSGTWTSRSTVTSGPMTATVTYDDGRVVEPACFAYRDASHRVETGGGAPPNARPPANDTPDTSRPLTTATTVQTSGAVLEAEEPMPCVEPWEEMPDYRPTHTVWFTVTGSGSTTLTTEGTRFDTALAVYTVAADGSVVPVDGACNDDRFLPVNPGLRGLSLQAGLTFVAEPGTAYLVQVGGVSSDANYGALKVAVSGRG